VNWERINFVLFLLATVALVIRSYARRRKRSGKPSERR
jgi:hypothetical protein